MAGVVERLHFIEAIIALDFEEALLGRAGFELTEAEMVAVGWGDGRAEKTKAAEGEQSSAASFRAAQLSIAGSYAMIRAAWLTAANATGAKIASAASRA